MLVKWVAEEQIANFPIDLIAKPRSAVLHWSSARDISLSLFDCTVVSFSFLFGLGSPVPTLIAAHLHLDWYGVVWERWICQVSERPIEALKRMSRLTEDISYAYACSDMPISHLFRPYFETSCVITEVSAKWWINKMERLLPPNWLA